MYLIHNTNIKSLKSILKDGYLKSLSLLIKEGYNKKSLDGEGTSLYDKNKFVYFSCIDKLFSRKIWAQVTLYFNSKLLFNKSFYISTNHSPAPNYLGEWWIKNEDGTKYKMYKRKYNKYYEKYDNVLKKLFKFSISQLENGKSFQIFQQIAVLNKVNLKELVAIEFNHKKDVNPNIINYIKKYYPEIEIKLND